MNGKRTNLSKTLKYRQIDGEETMLLFLSCFSVQSRHFFPRPNGGAGRGKVGLGGCEATKLSFVLSFVLSLSVDDQFFAFACQFSPKTQTQNRKPLSLSFVYT